MRESVRSASSLCIAWLVACAAIGCRSDALAQNQQQALPAESMMAKLPAVKQIALTEKQIVGLLAASKDINAITDNSPEDIDKLSPETMARLDAAARRNGLASYDEYKIVGKNIGLVFGGYDTVARKYVGKDALIKARIARVQADRKMSADRKKEALRDLKDDRRMPLPLVEYRNNIDLVVKYFDQLAATMRGD